MIEKWGAKLSGHDFDLADWREELTEPFDPYVELVSRENEKINVLWSSEFSDLQSADEVMQRAEGLIQRINGIMYLQRNCKPVSFDGSVRLVGGKISVDHFIRLEAAAVRMRANAVVVRIVKDGVEQPPPQPTASQAQGRLKVAAADDLVGDIFGLISDSIDWYDLYKVIELCERKRGGEHALAIALGDKARSWKDAKVTANFFRHARAHRPSKLMPLGEAKDVVCSVIKLIA